MIKLERENFRVDSTGWQKFYSHLQNSLAFRVNPRKDIWEYSGEPRTRDGRLAGQQLFTWSAAMRETAKVGKRMPTNKEWRTFTGHSSQNKEMRFGLVGVDCFPGFHFDHCFESVGHIAYFWSMDDVGSDKSWSFILSSDYLDAYCHEYLKNNGFSVRCLKN